MNELLGNRYLWIPVISWFTVQIFKVISELVIHKKFNFRRIMGAGGMPSSHTACIVSLATSIGIKEGLGSPLFALSAVFSFIVMYDAAGVRRAAGKQAKILNQLIENDGTLNVQEKLVELLGHTPVEVFVGLVVGVALGTFFSHLWLL